MNGRWVQEILHLAPVSYTLSFTRNPLETLQVSPTGVGNVGDFRKLFFHNFSIGEPCPLIFPAIG